MWRVFSCSAWAESPGPPARHDRRGTGSADHRPVLVLMPRTSPLPGVEPSGDEAGQTVVGCSRAVAAGSEGSALGSGSPARSDSTLPIGISRVRRAMQLPASQPRPCPISSEKKGAEASPVPSRSAVGSAGAGDGRDEVAADGLQLVLGGSPSSSARGVPELARVGGAAVRRTA